MNKKMRKINVLFVAATAALGVSVASCDSVKNAKLSNDVDSVSYAIGMVNGLGFGESLKTLPGKPVNMDALIAGMASGLKGDSAALKMDPEKAQAYIQEYVTNAQVKDAEETKEEGEKFLEDNKTKSGIFTTESGLQYQVITEGTGEKPQATDRVKVHYTGSLLDGTVFDTSIGNEPITFELSGVIPGWTEGLQIMPVGSKYIFWIPSNLAYGERGSGRSIKPNSTLKFEVELLEIVKE
jgi:FKBP-type peptidyl-prolyl cis-trans isomerase FkpA/FKBP-type peptidyl-prolyl cis-trans isomerase FklB